MVPQGKPDGSFILAEPAPLSIGFSFKKRSISKSGAIFCK